MQHRGKHRCAIGDTRKTMQSRTNVIETELCNYKLDSLSVRAVVARIHERPDIMSKVQPLLFVADVYFNDPDAVSVRVVERDELSGPLYRLFLLTLLI